MRFCRGQRHMVIVIARLLLVLLAFYGLELCDGQASVQWQDIPEPKHLRHKHHHGHKHKDDKPLVKGVDYQSHHQSHGELFDWNSFKPANPTPKEEMVSKLMCCFYIVFYICLYISHGLYQIEYPYRRHWAKAKQYLRWG